MQFITNRFRCDLVFSIIITESKGIQNLREVEHQKTISFLDLAKIITYVHPMYFYGLSYPEIYDKKYNTVLTFWYLY